MKQYLETIRYVTNNGVMRANDRTGKGRHSVFSPPDEIYDLSEGFPLTTLRAVNPDAMIDELLWFISGSTSVENLKFKFFWQKWVPTTQDLLDFCKRHGIESHEAYEVKDTETGELVGFGRGLTKKGEELAPRIGTIGNLYGVSWRKAPGPVGDFLPARKMADLPKDLLEKFITYGPDDKPTMSVDGLIDYLDSPESEDGMTEELKTTLRASILKAYWSNYDQLNELVYKIKTTPVSSRLRVSAYLTNYMAFEEFSPQENTLDGRACLTPCHTFFQCYVHTPKEEGGRGKLDLKLTLTSSDILVGRVYNIAQYALLLSMLAQVTGLDVGRLIISTGDAHIYGNQFEALETIINREPKQSPTLWLNPEVKSIFDFTADDIRIENYDPHPEVKVPVAL